MKKAMVIAPHVDDETLGVGGTIFKLQDEGWEIYLFNFTDTSDNVSNKNVIEKKKDHIEKARRLLKFTGIRDAHYLSAILDGYGLQELILDLDTFVQEVKPNLVFIPSGSDIHSDHRIVNEVCLSVFKPFRLSDLGVDRILEYEVLSSTEQAIHSNFHPDVFIDITKYIEKKMNVLSCYETELQEYPRPRNVRGVKTLAKWRGLAIGVEFAEGFKLVIEKV